MDISKQIEEVTNNFPALVFSSAENELTGQLFVSSSDNYDVVIRINGFPREFPHVFEVGERIPPKADRHIYKNSGRCCLTTRAKEQVLLKTKIKSLNDFISLIVVPFFQNNSYYEINKCYKEGEYSHGVPGVIDAYQEILRLDKKSSIVEPMEMLRSKDLGKNDPCYCNSGVTLKKCNNGLHLLGYRDFKLIDLEIIDDDLYKWIKPNLRELYLYKQFLRR